MPEFLQDPYIRGLLLPFAGAVILTILVRIAGRGAAGRHYAGAAVGVVLLWVCGMVLGMPAFPPSPDANAIGYLILIGWLVGLAVDALAQRGTWGTAVEAVALPVYGIGILWWIAGADRSFLETDSLVIAAVALAAWLAVVYRLRWLASAPHVPEIMLTAIAAGLAIIGWLVVMPPERDLAAGLAAALVGFLLVNLPAGRAPLASSLLLAAGGGALVIAMRLIEAVDIFGVSILLLVLVVFADTVASRVQWGPAVLRRTIRFLALIGLCLVPLLLAAVAALIESKLRS